MATIIVGFSKSNLIFSKLIRWFSKGEVSHSYIKIPVPDYGESIVFHAVWPQGVQYINYQLFKRSKIIVAEYEVEIDDITAALFERFRVQNAGKPYSMLGLLGYIPVMLGLRKKNLFPDGDKEFVCSEMVARAIGVENAEEVTPQQLLEICRELKKAGKAKFVPFL